jgi:KEOPS complex subunit Cgi121
MKLVEGETTVEDLDAFVEDLQRVGRETDCAVQAFDARLVAGERHLRSAVDHANRSMARGENVARDRAVEILLYAAGRRQIDQALALGVDAGTTPAVVVVDGEREEDAAAAIRERAWFAPGETMERRDEDGIREFFEVSDAERGATDADLAALVAERVALLDIEK